MTLAHCRGTLDAGSWSPRRFRGTIAAMDLTVADVRDLERFEATTAEGAVAGRILYTRDAAMVVLVETLVEPSFEGRGVGTQLAHGALEALRAEGVTVLAACPFIRRLVRLHPQEYGWVQL